jgi:cyclopropane fatty-acyl-phospholipid synthase-like methyltransferase
MGHQAGEVLEFIRETGSALTRQLESANFEIKSVDVLGVHYSATIHRWYLNWVSNKDKVVEKYGIRWYRIWVYFLAYSVM